MEVDRRNGKFQQYISSDLLGEEKVIIAATRTELRIKVERQLKLWEEQEEHLIGAQLAESKTQEAQALQMALAGILKQEVQKGTKPGWRGRSNTTGIYPPFRFKEAPNYEESVLLFVQPMANSFLEMFLPGRKKERERAKAQAQRHFQDRLAKYKEERATALKAYHSQRQAYEQGDPEAVKSVLRTILTQLDFPCGFGKQFEADFDRDSEEAVVEMLFPHVDEMPTIIKYRYVRQHKTDEIIKLRARAIQDRYQDLLAQMTLATLFRLFHDATTPYLQSIVFNGYVSGIHPATGRQFTSCILTVRVGRAEFETYNLEKVVPNTCLRSLRGLAAGPLIDLLPVRPIRPLERQDERFIETEDVLATAPSVLDIAQMSWQEFEHLIATLFNRIFQRFGGEVRVTRSSRDHGVDAIGFDPDPIRGGKVIIQAKYYHDLVSIAYVRELIGTMSIERATRGYLVTTGRFSKNAYTLAAQHNVQLFDGQQLLYQLHQHGFSNLTLRGKP